MCQKRPNIDVKETWRLHRQRKCRKPLHRNSPKSVPQSMYHIKKRKVPTMLRSLPHLGHNRINVTTVLRRDPRQPSFLSVCQKFWVATFVFAHCCKDQTFENVYPLTLPFARRSATEYVSEMCLSLF